MSATPWSWSWLARWGYTFIPGISAQSEWVLACCLPSPRPDTDAYFGKLVAVINWFIFSPPHWKTQILPQCLWGIEDLLYQEEVESTTWDQLSVIFYLLWSSWMFHGIMKLLWDSGIHSTTFFSGSVCVWGVVLHRYRIRYHICIELWMLLKFSLEFIPRIP